MQLITLEEYSIDKNICHIFSYNQGKRNKISMKKIIKDGIEEYQCSGCVTGCDVSCFEKDDFHQSAACGKHSPGTFVLGAGTFFLGMPKGFDRPGYKH